MSDVYKPLSSKVVQENSKTLGIQVWKEMNRAVMESSLLKSEFPSLPHRLDLGCSRGTLFFREIREDFPGA